MYTYERIDESGNKIAKKRFSRISQSENKLFMAVTALWINMVANEINIDYSEVPYGNCGLVARRLWEREKRNFSYDDYKQLFKYFFENTKKPEDKIAFDLCMSEKYVAKFKIMRSRKKITNASLANSMSL